MFITNAIKFFIESGSDRANQLLNQLLSRLWCRISKVIGM